jgi:hypothetical protein
LFTFSSTEFGSSLWKTYFSSSIFNFQGYFKVQEDKKHRATYQALGDSEKKFQFFAARQIACRLLGSRGYLCQKVFLCIETIATFHVSFVFFYLVAPGCNFCGPGCVWHIREEKKVPLHCFMFLLLLFITLS